MSSPAPDAVLLRRPPAARPPWWTCERCDRDVDPRFADRVGVGRYRCAECVTERES